MEGSRGEGGTHAEWRVVGEEGEEEENKEGEAQRLHLTSTDFPGINHGMKK